MSSVYSNVSVLSECVVTNPVFTFIQAGNQTVAIHSFLSIELCRNESQNPEMTQHFTSSDTLLSKSTIYF